MVYYKNTFSIFSYQSNPLFLVNSAIVTLDASHPEGWETIFANAAWPFKFVFSSNVDYYNGGYVLLQHTNALNKDEYGNFANKVSFIASTCDFSDNSPDFVSNNFASRPNCYAYRTNYNYPGTTNTVIPFNGSGVFFYLPSIVAEQNYNVIVWGYADDCGGDNTNAFDPQSTDTVVFTFQATIFKHINANAQFEQRLDPAYTSILGQSIVEKLLFLITLLIITFRRPVYLV
jgi:hypothetical protein